MLTLLAFFAMFTSDEPTASGNRIDAGRLMQVLASSSQEFNPGQTAPFFWSATITVGKIRLKAKRVSFKLFENEQPKQLKIHFELGRDELLRDLSPDVAHIRSIRVYSIFIHERYANKSSSLSMDFEERMRERASYRSQFYEESPMLYLRDCTEEALGPLSQQYSGKIHYTGSSVNSKGKQIGSFKFIYTPTRLRGTIKGYDIPISFDFQKPTEKK